MATAEDKKYLDLWNQYRENSARATPIDLKETPAEKRKRIEHLEAHPEEWKNYYFPHHCKSPSAPFHKRFFKRIINNPEWYEVISWSRELAKSTSVMMVVLFLVLTKRKRNILLCSDSESNAIRLLLPYKSELEANQRIINDYGTQESIGKWEAGEFITKKGASFRALGAGQNPRGTKNDAVRPDVILSDDIDTDELVRNAERVKSRVKWLTEALYACRSISEPLLWIACGNIIAKYSCITEMAKVADNHEIINIRDKEGKSTWPEKNTEELIDRALSKQPWSAQQKEYYNNPVSEGDTFKDITYSKCPPLRSCDHVVVYADPSTSNKDRGANKQASYKGVVVLGAKGRRRYLYKVWLDQTSNAKFVDWLYEAYMYVKEAGVDTHRIYIENNSLQDPHYQQVLLPLIYAKADLYGFTIPVTEDKRKKPDKFFRIEGTLEPLNRLGNLIFNVKEQKEPNMVRMHDQMIGVSESAKMMDGPDALEGAAWLCQNRAVKHNMSYAVGAIDNRKY
ncbi:hypothetical protein [Leeuwenhoekiella parthenopeia]|uniref:Terminase large subunit n=1 Tax=Leeuwenhoekiella parthenopeia TaxID=2890320 RepID=A0ABS8GNL6_9FLAO|nr:hypothetical protein [Leeuwenhoekiella parthenopeia]MCC4211361.1 hypothetical protein [Leeuwenhoekiella parthenopeia]